MSGTIKFPTETQGKSINDNGFGNNYSDMTSKAHITKAKTDTEDCMQLKNCCTSR